MDENGGIEVPVWWSNGDGMSYRRDCLPPDHPEHTYNYMKRELGVIPEHYGIYHPYYEQYKDMPREELINKLIELEKTISGMEQFL